jgi:hypothetical protein
MTTSPMLDNLPPGMRCAVAVSSETPRRWRIDEQVSYAMIVVSLVWFPARVFGAGNESLLQQAIGVALWAYVVYAAFKIKLYCGSIRFHFASDVSFDKKFMEAYERLRTAAESPSPATASEQLLIIPGKQA